MYLRFLGGLAWGSVASDLLLHLYVAFGLSFGLVLTAEPGPSSTNIVLAACSRTVL